MSDKHRQDTERISFDVIVVGAGLAGSAAAAIAARAGLKVALIERGQAAGGKNFFGGALYTHALQEIYPDLWERKPPLERPVTEAGFWFLSKDGLTRMTVQGGHLKRKPLDAYVALRARFDQWWAEQAQKEGVLLIPKTTVVDFLREPGGRVMGILTDRPQGEIYAPVVIVCEGVNNLLTQKLGLSKKDLNPASVALGVKQLIALPAETINARFGLPDKEHGLAVSVMGDVSMGLTGLGFIYTANESVSIGLGVNLDLLAEHKIKPYELLQRYLNHPMIAPLIAGGKLMEYGAHLIPEGGWREMPQLYTDGVMVAGDAAVMVNALHWEGTNMAIIAGKAAGETAVMAHDIHDFSAKTLSGYEDALKERFVLQDLYQYRNLSRFLASHPEFMDVYPAFLNDALGMFFSGYGQPKKQLYRDILRSLTSKRPLRKSVGDMLAFGKTVMGW
ncbi:MAG: FAD-dependent oxidoreductase [Anaerolineales bacterium]|jgi:electron transfer flavoprotein-quinone oxidoreductase